MKFDKEALERSLANLTIDQVAGLVVDAERSCDDLATRVFVLNQQMDSALNMSDILVSYLEHLTVRLQETMENREVLRKVHDDRLHNARVLLSLQELGIEPE